MSSPDTREHLARIRICLGPGQDRMRRVCSSAPDKFDLERRVANPKVRTRPISTRHSARFNARCEGGGRHAMSRRVFLARDAAATTRHDMQVGSRSEPWRR